MGSLTYAQATFAHPLLYPRPPLAHSGESEQMSPEQMSRYREIAWSCETGVCVLYPADLSR